VGAAFLAGDKRSRWEVRPHDLGAAGQGTGQSCFQPPEILPMTPEQRDAAIGALVSLLDTWLAAQRQFGSEGDVGGGSAKG
jgi:hypothetical protein